MIGLLIACDRCGEKSADSAKDTAEPKKEDTAS